MKNIRHIAAIFMVVAAVCFALSLTTFSVSIFTASDTYAASGEGQAVSNSLSKEKLMDLFWRVINFIALMIILVKFGAKPIGFALGNRQKQVKEELDDLEQRRDNAEKQYREFETKLSTVEKDIDSIVDKAVAQAEIEKAKIIEKAEKAVDDLKRSAELAVQNEIVEARRVLKDEIAEQAAAMAEELIVKNLTPEDQVKIIENYLDKVEAAQ
jgi:F-type H+-transporting ATPase subunit b